MKEKKYIYGWAIYIVEAFGFKEEYATLWQPKYTQTDVVQELRLLRCQGKKTKVVNMRKPNPAYTTE